MKAPDETLELEARLLSSLSCGRRSSGGTGLGEKRRGEFQQGGTEQAQEEAFDDAKAQRY